MVVLDQPYVCTVHKYRKHGLMEGWQNMFIPVLIYERMIHPDGSPVQNIPGIQSIHKPPLLLPHITNDI